MELPTLPSELIEKIITNGNVKELNNLCVTNKFFAKRCYDRTFWAPYLSQLSRKEYFHLLINLASLNNNKLFLFVIYSGLYQLSPKAYRDLIEQLAIMGKEYIIRLLIEDAPPNNRNERAGLKHAAEAAIFYAHYELAGVFNKIYKQQTDKDLFDAIDIEDRIISLELNIGNDKPFYIEANELLSRKDDERYICDIFSLGGNYKQLINAQCTILGTSREEKCRHQGSKLEVESKILERRYGNINLLLDLVESFPHEPLAEYQINAIITSYNQEARKYMIKHFNIERVTPRDFDTKYWISSAKLLRRFMKEYPEEAKIIVANSFDVFEDDEYIELVTSYWFDDDTLLDIITNLSEQGYQYMANILDQVFTE